MIIAGLWLANALIHLVEAVWAVQQVAFVEKTVPTTLSGWQVRESTPLHSAVRWPAGLLAPPCLAVMELREGLHADAAYGVRPV